MNRLFALCALLGALTPVLGCDSDDPAATADLTAGAVFSMSNARAGNEVAAFARAADGTLTLVGRYPTGGTGSGSFEDSANGVVLASAQGESSPNNVTSERSHLFVTNPGSNSVTVFRVTPGGLERVETQPSGGEKPVSLTVNRGLLYVLHSGETTDDLLGPDGMPIPNCTTGSPPSITGFRVSADGALDPLPNSTRALSGDAFSGCAQVTFNPAGTVLVVAERTAVNPPASNDRMPPGDEGLLVTFAMNADGTPGARRLVDATGQGPFGFTFDRGGRLFVTEQFDGPMGPALGAAAGYTVAADGSLAPTGPSVGNGGTDTCWFILSNDGRTGYAVSFFNPTPRISSYRVTAGGALELLDATAADVAEGAADVAMSRDGGFLYNVNAFTGMVSVFRVGSDGALTSVQAVRAHPASAMAGVFGLAAS